MDFDALFAKRSSQIKPGLQRIERSYEFLGRPAAHIPAVLIGGTNGKGSTSGFLWHLMALNGEAVGLYSSPHLAAFSERCQLSQRPCDDAELSTLWRNLQQKLPAEFYEELSFFEIATLLAFQLFAERALHFQVLEVGLGGRWDATNVSDPLLSAVVSLSRDHQEYLGSDLLQILDEKLGIMRPGRPLFWGDSGEIVTVPGYREHIIARAESMRSPLFQAGENFCYDSDRQTIELNLPLGVPCSLPMQGVLAETPLFLRKNLAIAAAMYQYLQQVHPELKLQSLARLWPQLMLGQGPAPVTLFGRSQRIKVATSHGAQRLILDVCHNPDGAAAFLAGLKSRGIPPGIPALVSILRDKELDRILDSLRSMLHPVILFGIDHERAWQPESLAARHRDLPFFPSFSDAWQAALTSWKLNASPWVVCGSVLAVGRILQYFACAPKDGISLERILRGDW